MTYRSRWWYGTTPAIAVTAIALLVLSCGDGTVEPPALPPAPVATTVTVTPATATLTALEETVRFTAEVRDQNGQVMTGATVAWTSSDASVAAVDASGQATAAANGSATITATAGSASGTAAVTVRLNRSPEAAASIPDMRLRRPVLLDALTYFTDPDGDTLTYTVETSEAIVAFGYVSDDAELGIAPVGQGSATLTVTATDPLGASVEQSFLVTVGNQAPYSVADLTNLNMVVGSTNTLDLSGYFRDPEGQQLSHGARDLFQPGVAVSLTGSVLTLEAVTDERDPKMEPRVAVSATDGDETARQYFDVFVAPLAPPAGARYERQGSTIVLHWEPSAEATHYNIYHHNLLDRCGVRPDGSTFLCNELATGVQGNTYTHTDPDQNTNRYWIVACGAAGCSYPGWAGLPLDVYASVSVVDRDHSSLTLNLRSRWAERVELYRSTAPDGPYSLVDGAVATKGQNDLVHFDDGLSADATYYYRIKACTDAGCTDHSPPAAGRTEASGPVAIPPPATGIRGTKVEVPLGTDEAEIGWDDVPGATYYRVYQEGMREAEVAAPRTSYYDAHPNSRVFEFVPTPYQVLACNKAGCSSSAASIVVR